MKKIYIALIAISLVVIYTNSSRFPEQSDISGKYKLRWMDSTTFEKYNFICFRDSVNKDRFVISGKINKQTDSTVMNDFVYLRVGKVYHLDLRRIDSTFVMKAHILLTKQQISVYGDDSLIYWQDDTVRTTIYTTDDIKGLYVRKANN